MDVFVKNSTGQLFYGRVWNPVNDLFVDWTHPNATTWWAMQMRRWRQQIPVDGTWIEYVLLSRELQLTSFVRSMNDPATGFGNAGQVDPFTGQYDLEKACPWNDPIENPPYNPVAPFPLQGGPVLGGSLCLTARQHLGIQYDLRNMYSLYEAKSIKEWVQLVA